MSKNKLHCRLWCLLNPALNGQKVLQSHCTKTVTESTFVSWRIKNPQLTERRQYHQIFLSGHVPWGLLNQLRTFLMLSQEHLSQPTEKYHTLHCSLNGTFPSFSLSLHASSDMSLHLMPNHLPKLTSQGSCGLSPAHYFPGARIRALSAARTDISLEQHKQRMKMEDDFWTNSKIMHFTWWETSIWIPAFN